jgi:hypothetical protein
MPHSAHSTSGAPTGGCCSVRLRIALEAAVLVASGEAAATAAARSAHEGRFTSCSCRSAARDPEVELLAVAEVCTACVRSA